MKIFLISLIFSISTLAQVPELSSPVMDLAQVLNNKNQLNDKIRSLYKDGTGPQITILTVTSLNGESIEEFSNKVFTSWKLGDKKRDDGVLLVISIKDHRSRIEVGQGLEGSLTDLQSKRILASLRDYFRAENYSLGIEKGLDQIIEVVSKKDAVQTVSQPTIKADKKDEFEISPLFTILCIAGSGLVLILGGRVSRKKVEIKNLNDLIESVDKNINENKKYLKSLEVKYSKNINQIQKELKDNASKILSENEALFDSQTELRDSLLRSPMGKRLNKEGHIFALTKSLNKTEESISELNSVISGAKNE